MSDEDEPVIPLAAAPTSPMPTVPRRTAELEGLFRAYHARILRTAYRMLGSTADAEDILQAVFLRLTGGLENYHLGAEPGGYIHRMTVNACLDRLRERPRAAVDLEAVEAALASSAPGPEHQHRDRELRAALRDAIAQLSPRAAQIFTLRFLEDRDNTSIARELGMSRATVGVVLHRARQQVRQALARHLESRHA